MKNELRNELTIVTIDFEKKEISGRDLTDINNQPSFYNTNVRTFKKACAKLVESFSDTLTMWDCMRILSAENLRTRSYCAMD